MNEINRKVMLWSILSFYWFIYYIYESEFIFGAYPGNHWVVTAYCFLVALYGAVLSLVLKYIYGLKFFRKLPKYYLLIVLVISSFVVSHLWLPEIYFLDFIIKKYFGFETIVFYWPEIVSMTITLLIWSFLYLLLNSWYELSVEKVNVEKAQLLAKNSQLNSLRYQLNPHFLFNVLNSVRALIYKSPEIADEMISKLSEFMRYSLTHKDELEVPLENEIDIINNYLNIEKTRFGNKLDVQIQIDPIAYEFPIPPFLVLPLVENAVKFGMKTSTPPLKILISAKIKETELVLSIKNTGHWVEETEWNENSTLTGLRNIKNRLANFYPGNSNLKITKKDDNVSITITINKGIDKTDYVPKVHGN